jgi:PTH1 family peptidyl-tRNA hydrolase
MKLIVGLGNPGSEYKYTLHNAGFSVVDEYLAAHKSKNEEILFAKPQTYMNLSGDEVSKLLKKHKIESNGLLIIHDEADLPIGKIQLKFGGGTGGHNGLNSIVEKTGTQDFWRLRIGVGKDSSKNLADYVLEPVPKSLMKDLGEHGAKALEIILKNGFQTSLNQINAPHFQRNL